MLYKSSTLFPDKINPFRDRLAVLSEYRDGRQQKKETPQDTTCLCVDRQKEEIWGRWEKKQHPENQSVLIPRSELDYFFYYFY